MTALSGIKVIELANERVSLAGKLMADMGAEVLLIEPPDGCVTRSYAPHASTPDGTSLSLYFSYYNTNKRSIVLDLEQLDDQTRLKSLLSDADILLESEPTQRLAHLGLDFADLQPLNPDLIHVAVTPYGRDNPDSDLPCTDLTLMAAGGPPWSCGYDDHTLPPVRGWGQQGFHTGCHFAFMSALTALWYRKNGGSGQFIDVSITAALNITTEAATYTHFINGGEVQRQTGRHAAINPTGETQMQCADGRYVNTGVPPRFPEEFARLLKWLTELGLTDQFPEAVFLEMGAAWEGPFDLSLIGQDDTITAIFSAGREGLQLIAQNIGAYDFFIGCQQAGLAVGIINTPDEAFEDPHFIERGFQIHVDHGAAGTFRYPGAPYLLPASPWAIHRPAPELDQDREEILADIKSS